MSWIAVVVILWAGGANTTPPVLQIPVESQMLCEKALKTLELDLGKKAAEEALGNAPPQLEPPLLLSTCVRVR